MGGNKTLKMSKGYLDKDVTVVVDRPLGSKHPKHGFEYEANYGYIPGTLAPDGEELDAYYLGIGKPVNEARGKYIAIIHRLNDDDDKLVVVPPKSEQITDKEITKAVHFQEQWFKYKILRK